MDRLGIGLSLHPDPEYLDLVRPLVENEVDYFEVNPEALWEPRGETLVPGPWHEIFQELRARSGKPFVGHGLAFSPGTPLDGSEAERRRTETWLESLRHTQSAFGFAWISEHLGWCTVGGLQATLPLPLPGTREAAATVTARLKLLRRIAPEVLIENGARLFTLGSWWTDPLVLLAATRDVPCSLLLDLHNLHTESLTFGFAPEEYLARLDLSRVVQIHLSGGSLSDPAWLPSGRVFRLDSHDGPVPEEVWQLLEQTLPRTPRLRGIVVERMNGTLARKDVGPLAEEVRRARELWQFHVARWGTPSEPPPRQRLGLVDRSGLHELERAVLGSLLERVPAETLVDRLPASRALGDLLAGVDADGFRLAGLLVRNLRCDRLFRGDPGLERLAADDPEAFAARFQAYEAAVPPRACFPAEDAAAFRAWSEGAAPPP